MQARRFEIVNQEQFMTEEMVKQGVSNQAVTKWAYIRHDKDTKEDGTPKEPHFHVLVWLKAPYDSKYVARWFGQEEQYVQRIKSESGAEEYLTHENAPEKHHYDKTEIKANFDVEKDIQKQKAKKNFNARLVEIVMAIDSGEIRQYNIQEKISIVEYDKYKKHIDNAFAYRTKKIKGADRQMECVYIVGESGCGKTTYAKEIAKGRNFSVYVSSGTNDVLDDYEGQDCIILDDLRPSTLHLADLLKMLDNNTASSVKSRYRNKVLECKMIIITTTMPIEKFFHNVFQESPESAVQLMRRCKTLIRMNKKYIQYSIWSDVKGKYETLSAVPNVVLAQFEIREKTLDEKLEYLQKTLAMGSNLISEIRQKSMESGIDNRLEQLGVDGKIHFEDDDDIAPFEKR